MSELLGNCWKEFSENLTSKEARPPAAKSLSWQEGAFKESKKIINIKLTLLPERGKLSLPLKGKLTRETKDKKQALKT